MLRSRPSNEYADVWGGERSTKEDTPSALLSPFTATHPAEFMSESLRVVKGDAFVMLKSSGRFA